MPRSDHPADPTGLIQEAYRMEALSAQECRSILFDWILARPEGGDAQADFAALLADYGQAQPDHPMTHALKEGLESPPPRRRGGRSGRGG